MGPVQVLVVGFEDPAFSGEVLAELTRLGEAGIVRLVDLLLVARSADGTLLTLDPPAGLGPGYGEVVAALLGGSQNEPSVAAEQEEAGPAHLSAWSLADAVAPGTSAAVALIEHVWAGPLRAAIHRAGGAPLDETWLAPEDVAALEALMAGRGIS